uniref:Uncharacterized protein n=1 Tax=Anguilla anguilla TaxID=7936 RepID=A0A0E9RDM0_ANGAN
MQARTGTACQAVGKRGAISHCTNLSPHLHSAMQATSTPAAHSHTMCESATFRRGKGGGAGCTAA